ncbi:unnamed protein product [Rotaria magnacalcarata]|nr:unnamed protein product [Rotaria magnacalcarata]
MTPIQQMITSLQPKQKRSLIEYIPDFESYNDDINIHDYDTELSPSLETYDVDIQGSLSEQLYNKLDQPTTRRPKVTTNKTLEQSLIFSIQFSIISHRFHPKPALILVFYKMTNL